MQTITTRRNAVVTRFRDAARGELEDLVLLDGVHLVGDALAAGLRLQQVVISTDAAERPEMRAVLEALSGQDVAVAAATSMVMDAVSPVRSSSGIVALADRPAAGMARVYAHAAPLAVIAVDIQDPGNLGAIIRVAEAAGATGVVACGGSANPFGWKALRGSMGSGLRLPVAVHHDVAGAVEEARAHHCRVVATVPHGGDAPDAVDFRGPVALVIGGEGAGLPADLIAGADARVSIPMQRPVESLNAAAATAILVYEARRQRR